MLKILGAAISRQFVVPGSGRGRFRRPRKRGTAVDPVSIHDLHATILHQLGIDHEQLTYNINGLETRLTGVEKAHVIDAIIS